MTKNKEACICCGCSVREIKSATCNVTETLHCYYETKEKLFKPLNRLFKNYSYQLPRFKKNLDVQCAFASSMQYVFTEGELGFNIYSTPFELTTKQGTYLLNLETMLEDDYDYNMEQLFILTGLETKILIKKSMIKVLKILYPKNINISYQFYKSF